LTVSKPVDQHRRRSNEPLHKLAARLREHDRKLTGPRQAILEILGTRRGPLTIKEVAAALPKNHCNLTTIYRAMHLLEEAGMVKRFNFGDGSARFELLPEGDSGHHHHLICKRCAAVVEVEECIPHDLEAALATRHGFKAVEHRLEFFGVCPECQP
jgi:Fur family ferric uptake transcriptional regulator